MKKQTYTWLVALLVAMLLALPPAALSDSIPVTGTITITEELTDQDFFTDDGSGTFYYDIIEFEATSDLDLLITLSSDDFFPYLAWGTDIPTPLPEPSESDPGAPYIYFAIDDCLMSTGSASVPHWYPTSGQVFQVVVATCDYIEDGALLGAYTVTVAEVPVPVPEPGSLALFGIGLVGLAALRRRRQR